MTRTSGMWVLCCYNDLKGDQIEKESKDGREENRMMIIILWM